METRLFWCQKVKGQGHKIYEKPVSVFRHDAILPLAAYVSNAGFFTASVLRRTSHASDTEFSLRHTRRTAGFSVLVVFFVAVSRRQNVAGVMGQATLVSASFF